MQIVRKENALTCMPIGRPRLRPARCLQIATGQGNPQQQRERDRASWWRAIDDRRVVVVGGDDAPDQGARQMWGGDFRARCGEGTSWIDQMAQIHTLSPGQSIIVGLSIEPFSPLVSRLNSDMTKPLAINPFYALCGDLLSS
jgi:hypothetical protein